VMQFVSALPLSSSTTHMTGWNRQLTRCASGSAAWLRYSSQAAQPFGSPFRTRRSPCTRTN
jgi:hypothetical protein